MVTALILAAGVGQRMRNSGLPKQFLNLMGKPIVMYTLEKFEQCDEVDRIVIACHASYTDYMEQQVKLHGLQKVTDIIVGGADRQDSIGRGLSIIESGGADDDVILLHDGVRPLIEDMVIRENIRIARLHGCAITVHPVTESVVVTETEDAVLSNFTKRAATYSMTSPQTFLLGELKKAFNDFKEHAHGLPLLDAAMLYASRGGRAHLVKEFSTNIKITTPEDFYYLKAILEMRESKSIFGL